MKLPYGNAVDRKQIIHKLETYTLNFDHDKGKHKARIFRARLGITLVSKEILILELVKAVVVNDAKFKSSSEHGDQYAVECFISNSLGSSVMRSIWIIRPQEQLPRLS